MGSERDPSAARTRTDGEMDAARPAPMTERHENVGPFPIHSRGRLGVRFAAGCSCGWRSEPYPTAGMAGSAFDTHVGTVTGVG